MKCERCQGLMLEDHFMDMQDWSEGMWITTWRCMNCGYAVDPIIVANRERHALFVASHVVEKMPDDHLEYVGRETND
jgi:hypothetical protein